MSSSPGGVTRYLFVGGPEHGRVLEAAAAFDPQEVVEILPDAGLDQLPARYRPWAPPVATPIPPDDPARRLAGDWNLGRPVDGAQAWKRIHPDVLLHEPLADVFPVHVLALYADALFTVAFDQEPATA